MSAYNYHTSLADPRYADDERIKRLRHPCRCGAAVGALCRTKSGYPTLHKTRGGAA